MLQIVWVAIVLTIVLLQRRRQSRSAAQKEACAADATVIVSEEKQEMLRKLRFLLTAHSARGQGFDGESSATDCINMRATSFTDCDWDDTMDDGTQLREHVPPRDADATPLRQLYTPTRGPGTWAMRGSVERSSSGSAASATERRHAAQARAMGSASGEPAHDLRMHATPFAQLHHFDAADLDTSLFDSGVSAHRVPQGMLQQSCIAHGTNIRATHTYDGRHCVHYVHAHKM